MNSINFDVLPFLEGNTHITVCPDLGTVDQGNTLEEALANLLQTTHIYLQKSNQANIIPNLVVEDKILTSPSPSLPQVSACKVIAVLERLGFCRTSHCVVLKKQSYIGDIICVVPLRNPLASSTTWNILYSAGITHQEFLENL
jgi:predicted RNase H-like HicB family nuclease/predicted RNA binding protein YcfA (HicA-like mRNA interferase family)